MRPHFPSLRDVAVLLVDGLARVAEAVLDRADAVVCRASNDMSGDDE